MSALQVAVWGLGRHGTERILPAISEAHGLSLRGVCGRDADRVSSVAARWNCSGWTTPQAMLRDPEVEVVYVATPTGLHAEHGMMVLEAGKHLWCEKPLTCALDTTLAVLERSRNQNLSVGEGFMYLHHPQFRQLSTYVRQGRLGTIRSIGCRFGIPRLDFQSFRTDPALGGGALFDVGCYTICAVQALFPDAQWRVHYSRMTAQEGSAVDTDGHAVLEASSGVVAHLEWRTNCAYLNDISIWGDEGTLFTNKIFSKPPTYAPEFRLRDVRGIEEIHQGDACNHFIGMLEAFVVMATCPETSEAERQRIATRAEALDRIRAGSE